MSHRRRSRRTRWPLAAVLAVAASVPLWLAGSPGDDLSLPELLERVCGPDSRRDGAYAVTPDFCRMEPGTVKLARFSDEPVEIPVLIADGVRERIAGYQHIGPAVVARTAILFVFPGDARGPFHMCNVEVPLDIAWFRSDGAVVDIQRMEPGPRGSAAGCPQLYEPRSGGFYRFALEAPAGFFEAAGITPDSVRLVVDEGER